MINDRDAYNNKMLSLEKNIKDTLFILDSIRSAAEYVPAILEALEKAEKAHQILSTIMPEFCPCCKNEIDPEVCWCGTAVKDHGVGDGHSPVPIGCSCYFGD